MLSLNLLTPERKEMFRWRTRTKSVVFWGIKILSILFVFSAHFIAINLYMGYEISKLDKDIASYENTEKVKEIRQTEESSKKINETLISINKISEEQVYWRDALEEFIGIIPANVQIFSMDIGLGGKFMVAGVAKSRKDLLYFGEKMKGSADFKNIQLPMENLTKKDDVDFQFKGDFLLDRFKGAEKIKSSASAEKIEGDFETGGG